MDGGKTGELIRAERLARGLTQKALADALHVSDKAISKWERGQGCPDISLLGALAAALDVRIERLLEGELNENDTDGGNMKHIKFYVCPHCGGIVTATGDAEIACCGRGLTPLAARKADDAHRLTVRENDGEYYISSSHEMRKEHYITFVSVVSWDRALIVRLYPEQNAELRVPFARGTIYFHCSRDGLFING